MEQKSAYELLQEVRYELSKADLKKSGYNKHLNFNYFELADFMPLTTKLFYERGLCPMFNIYVASDGIEYASLTILKGPEQITFKIPTAESNNSANPIQNQGSKDSYMRRYLYVNHVLELVENDPVDSADPNAKKTNFATKFQVDKLSQNKDLMLDKFKEMGIRTVNDMKSLTVEQASELLKELETRLKNAD